MSLKGSYIFLLIALPILTGNNLFSQVTLTGKVTDSHTGRTLPGATIYIPDLKTGAASDSNGNYKITNLPKSSLLIQVSYVGYGAVVEQVDLHVTKIKDFQLAESPIEAQAVVITGSGISTDNSRSSVSITPISKNELITTPSTNLIDAISDVPGLAEITTGGNVSKPVIRGLSYNHVVTLNEGVRQEGQQWGDEHGIEVDQFSADRIEVLKGPASLFYGSDAMGGVINILEPIHAPMNSIRGELISQFATNSRMTNSSLMVEGNQDGFIWRARGSYKNAASYRSPPEFVYNSCFNEMNLSAMAGLNKKWGYTHLHLSRYDANIGMVEGERDSVTGQFINPSGEIVPESVVKGRKLEVPYQNVQLSKITSVSTLIFSNSQVRLNIGFQENNRREFESDEDDPTLYMRLNTLTYDAKFTHQTGNMIEWVAGLSGMTQWNQNRGVEFLIPDYHLQDAGGFIYLKKSWKPVTFNAGIRLDHRSIEGSSLFLDSLGLPSYYGDTIFPGFNSGYTAFSGSTGVTYSPVKVLNFKLNAGSGFRAPNIAELGSNGVHPGTLRYEIGNADLKPENSLQIDGEISFNIKWLSATFSGYYNFIFNYIYPRNVNGEQIFYQEHWYPVYRFVQGNSVLTGFEFELDFHPVENLHFENDLDYVSGTNKSTGIPLPLIPPLHSIHELKWHFKTSAKSFLADPYIAVSAEFNYAQDRIDTYETPTPGYFLLNASAGSQLRIWRQTWTFFISGKNLTNTTYVDHLNRLKEIGIYNMGLNVTFGIVIPFGLYAE